MYKTLYIIKRYLKTVLIKMYYVLHDFSDINSQCVNLKEMGSSVKCRHPQAYARSVCRILDQTRIDQVYIYIYMYIYIPIEPHDRPPFSGV